MTDESNAQIDQAPEADAASPTAALEAELAKARDEMLRALAEVENTRRRAERTAQEARTYAIDRFALDLLPVADTLSRALAAAPRDDVDEGFRNLLTGVELTERALIDAFERHGLKRVGAKGDVIAPSAPRWCWYRLVRPAAHQTSTSRSEPAAKASYASGSQRFAMADPNAALPPKYRFAANMNDC
jgi:hypothetical protein